MTECWLIFLVLAVGLAQSRAQDTLTPALNDLLPYADSSQQLWNQQGLPQGLNLQDLALADKRSWNSFHGSWGKRAPSWNNLHGSWDKRGIQEALLEELSKRAHLNHLQDSVEKRAWSKLRGAWGKRSDEDLHDEDSQLPSSALNTITGPAGFSQEALQPEEHTAAVAVVPLPHKRGWSIFNGSWFKRPQIRSPLSPRSTNWSSLRGTWGKRSGKSNWSSLRGTWGKRGQDWNNFRGSWGKRDNQMDSSDMENM